MQLMWLSGPTGNVRTISITTRTVLTAAVVIGLFLVTAGFLLHFVGFKIAVEYNPDLARSIGGVTTDRRLQLLLIAFSFGAFFEGAAGFGTPVAVTAAILIGLGFSPLAASGLSLIANTAPVAYGALGTPVITLAKVHGYDVMAVTGMIGRQLPFFSLMVPFWLIWAFAGFRGMMQIWPAILVTGGSFAIMQFLVSNYIGPELVDVIAAVVSMVCLVGFLKVWQPAEVWTSVSLKGHENDGGTPTATTAKVAHSRADQCIGASKHGVSCLKVALSNRLANSSTTYGRAAPEHLVDPCDLEAVHIPPFFHARDCPLSACAEGALGREGYASRLRDTCKAHQKV